MLVLAALLLCAGCAAGEQNALVWRTQYGASLRSDGRVERFVRRLGGAQDAPWGVLLEYVSVDDGPMLLHCVTVRDCALIDALCPGAQGCDAGELRVIVGVQAAGFTLELQKEGMGWYTEFQADAAPFALGRDTPWETVFALLSDTLCTKEDLCPN